MTDGIAQVLDQGKLSLMSAAAPGSHRLNLRQSLVLQAKSIPMSNPSDFYHTLIRKQVKKESTISNAQLLILIVKIFRTAKPMYLGVVGCCLLLPIPKS